ncbi:hypothetical protein TMatcc_008901 [Talaromyces marneffei ATCC 18224]
MNVLNIRCWPSPVFARANKAAMIELHAYNPVVKSVTATPTLTGGPSLEPVKCINPNSASTMTSNPGRLLYGPV